MEDVVTELRQWSEDSRSYAAQQRHRASECRIQASQYDERAIEKEREALDIDDAIKRLTKGGSADG